jgi:hypothetical protein
MTHQDCIGLLQIDAERSGIHREAIERLNHYRDLLESVLLPVTEGCGDRAYRRDLAERIQEAIR